MAEKIYTAKERAEMFALATRQNLQMLAKQTANGGATTLSFNLPKARLLSKILVKVKANVSVIHDSLTEIPVDVFRPYKLVRRWSLDLNNGFTPFVVSGEELAMFNMLHMNGKSVYGNEGKEGYTKASKLTASVSGAENEVVFTCELPVTLNDRDPIGLILLQNDQTNVHLVCDIANDSDFVSDISGASAKINSIEIMPMLETFSIPSNANAMPDLSILKLVTGRTDSMPSSGQQIVKLSTGNIYRRIIFKVVDENGLPFTNEDFLSTIDLVFNQADVNYAISADMLKALNERMYGYTLPNGMYVFDFAYNGLVGLSGTRDYIDTENLTEMWLRFNAGKKGKVEIVTETLSRLV